jgi:polar amino acid transport system substrate-binding protein
MAFRRALTLVSIAGLALSACAGPAATSAPTASPTLAPTASPTATAAPTPSPSPSPDACAPENLTLKNPGRLTLSTDNPAYPPWWGGDPATQYPNEPAGGSGWELSDPYSMEGFEGATAYAIAQAMGFTPDKVDWIQNATFENAFAPGEKPFDFHMAQIAITPERAQAVDFSDPYFDSNQAIVALTPNAITSATSIADLRAYRLGAAASTTSYDFIVNTIKPTPEVQSFQSNDLAVEALKGDVFDGLVIDLSSAFYVRDGQLEDFDTPDPEGTIVGQFGPPAEPDHVGAVLELSSPLTPCVDAAIAKIKADGTLQAILDKWINTGQDIPFLQ